MPTNTIQRVSTAPSPLVEGAYPYGPTATENVPSFPSHPPRQCNFNSFADTERTDCRDDYFVFQQRGDAHLQVWSKDCKTFVCYIAGDSSATAINASLILYERGLAEGKRLGAISKEYEMRQALQKLILG